MPRDDNGEHVEIDWSWDGLSGKVDGVEIHNDHGTGTLSLLANSTPPPAPREYPATLLFLDSGYSLASYLLGTHPHANSSTHFP